METYCVKCRKQSENWNLKIFKTKNDRLIMQSQCTECGFKMPNSWKNKKQKDYWVVWELKHHWVKSNCKMFCCKCKNEWNC